MVALTHKKKRTHMSQIVPLESGLEFINYTHTHRNIRYSEK